MTTQSGKLPWAYIAHKDGEWIGLQSAMVRDADSERTLGRWVADGLTITTTYTREEYTAELAKLTPYDPDKHPPTITEGKR